MKKGLIQEFTARIAQASKSELVVITYDIILLNITSAKEAYVNQDKEGFVKELKNIGRLINELVGSLDYRFSISHELLSLYSFANKRVIAAQMKYDSELLDGVYDIIDKLRIGFLTVSEQDKRGPVMKNSQQVYAGLTYGKGTLNETCLNWDEDIRGFKA